MTDSYEIMNSAFEWLNSMEMKEEVSRRWDALADEDHTHRLTEKNTYTIRTNGGFIQISKVLIPYHWEIVLISHKRCLLWNDNNKQEKKRTCLITLTNTIYGSWHRVHLQNGGIRKVHGGLLTIQKVKEGASQVLNERWDPLFIVLWQNKPKMAFTNSVYFVTDGFFTADGGLL